MEAGEWFPHTRQEVRLMGRSKDETSLPVFVILCDFLFIFHDDADGICRRGCLLRRARGMDHEARGIDPFAADRFSYAKSFRRRR